MFIGVFEREQIVRQLYPDASRILSTMRSYLSNGMTTKHCCAAAFCQLVRGEDRAPCLTGRNIFGCQICCATRCTLDSCQLARGEDRDLSRVGVFLVLQSTANIVAMKVCQFQKDRDEQARCEFERVLLMNARIVGYILASFALSTAGIVVMQMCQFQKDRDEQARCEFERLLSMNVRIVSYILASLVLSTADIVHRIGCRYRQISFHKHAAVVVLMDTWYHHTANARSHII